MAESLQGDDPETVRSILSYHSNFYEELRKAHRNLALVGIVTRLQHWINNLARQTFPNEKPQTLLRQLRLLNGKLGQGPVKLEFFEELVTVRDSIIHADSAAEWEYPPGKPRQVADRYAYGDTSDGDWAGRAGTCWNSTLPMITWEKQ